MFIFRSQSLCRHLKSPPTGIAPGFRYKVTVTAAEASPHTRKRPMPVLFIGTSTAPATAARWQHKLSDLGFDSAVAQFSDPVGQGDTVLQTWYTELHHQVQKMAMFPPVMIGHGDAAWRLCQKYVANQPLSALVLIDGPSSVDAAALPSYEFEPFFPIMAASNHAPAFLLEHKDDVDVFTPDEGAAAQDEEHEKHVLAWMADSI